MDTSENEIGDDPEVLDDDTNLLQVAMCKPGVGSGEGDVPCPRDRWCTEPDPSSMRQADIASHGIGVDRSLDLSPLVQIAVHFIENWHDIQERHLTARIWLPQVCSYEVMVPILAGFVDEHSSPDLVLLNQIPWNPNQERQLQGHDVCQFLWIIDQGESRDILGQPEMEHVDESAKEVLDWFQGVRIWDPPTSSEALSSDSSIKTLQTLLNQLREPWPKDGLHMDYGVIPNLHPHARLVCHEPSIFQSNAATHIYTDGSARKDGSCAWAFHVVQKQLRHDESHFSRVGYTGQQIDCDLWAMEAAAVNAEALALIYAASWIMTIEWTDTVTLHFDATAAGFGACGTQNIPQYRAQTNDIQRFARIMLTLAQAHCSFLQWEHINAHSGQPDNEAADSIAAALAKGWISPCKPPERCLALKQHPLREWAWLQISPTEELPDLANLLSSSVDPPCRDHCYLDIGQEQHAVPTWDVRWRLASANVRTLEDGLADLSTKAQLIERQAEEGHVDILALQETRCKHTQCIDCGSYIKLNAAAEQGQGGVALWIKRDGAFAKTGFGMLRQQDLVVWCQEARLLGVTCLHPAFQYDIVVIYAPQSGWPKEHIEQWWHHLTTIIESRPSQHPVFVLGDCNAKIGSVVNDFVGDHALDMEDPANSCLRRVCEQFQIVAPATLICHLASR